jgi:hypothetical protein
MNVGTVHYSINKPFYINYLLAVEPDGPTPLISKPTNEHDSEPLQSTP